MIRNAGSGLVNDETLRSLVISSDHLLGTQEVIVIGHTDCGTPMFTNDDILTPTLGPSLGVDDFELFPDLGARVRQSVEAIASAPLLPDRSARRDSSTRSRRASSGRFRARAAPYRAWPGPGTDTDPSRNQDESVAASVISGTPASAFETGQFAFAGLRRLLEAGGVEAGTRP